ncbi:MAG: methyltransferase [Planctomycetia bacterium]|nr:methyltransferase [Planctomycetia bacterium]
MAGKSSRAPAGKLGAEMTVDEPRAGLGTDYGGPVATSAVVVGGRAVVLVRPSDPDRMLDDPGVLAWNRRDDYMPYWAYLWPGAFLLAEAVAAEPWGVGLEALEVGCGLGLAGLAGVQRGLRVTFTDYDDAPLVFVARSASANGFDPASYSTRRLDWREPAGDRFPVILGADVLYERRLVPLVADVLAARLAPGGLALIADPYRAAAEGFAAAVASRGLSCEAVAVSAGSTELGTVRGTLHRVTRPVGIP